MNKLLIGALLIAVSIMVFMAIFRKLYITGTVKVGDISIRYKSYGYGKPLLLITGFGSSMRTWDIRLILSLAPFYRVIIFDNRGIGGTNLGTKPYTIMQCVEDTKGLLEQLHIQQANIFGHSMGSCIAQEFALRYPNKLIKLILGGSNAVGQSQMDPDIRHKLEDTSGTDQEMWQRKLKIIFPEHWLKKHYNLLTKKKVIFNRAAMQKQIAALKQWHGTDGRLSQIGVPTLIVVGTQDVITPPSNSLAMVQKIPRAWLAQFEDCGHGLVSQEPYKLSRLIKVFLD